jgi:hypothetical protein
MWLPSAAGASLPARAAQARGARLARISTTARHPGGRLRKGVDDSLTFRYGRANRVVCGPDCVRWRPATWVQVLPGAACGGHRPRIAAKVEGRTSVIRQEIAGPSDHDRVIVSLLVIAWRQKARFVSDLEIVTYSLHDDETMECRTRLRPVKVSHSSTRVVTTPGRQETRQVSTPVTKTQVRSSYECRNVPHTELRREPYTTQQCGYSGFGTSRSYSCKSVSRSRLVTRSTTRRQCSFVPKTQTVTTNEYRYETRYVPPQRRRISDTRSEWKLVPTEPSCKPHRGPTSAGFISGRAHWPDDG